MAANDGYLPFPKGFATAAIHAGQDAEQWDSMCVVPPIVTSTTFKQYGPADFKALSSRINYSFMIFLFLEIRI